MIAILGVQPLIQAMRPPEPLSGRKSKPLGNLPRFLALQQKPLKIVFSHGLGC
jgi:hypothetical protein